MEARHFAAELAQPRLQQQRAVIAILFLLLGLFASDRLVRWSEQHIFGDPIIHAQTTPYQRLIVTRWRDDLRLYINGNLQFSTLLSMCVF